MTQKVYVVPLRDLDDGPKTLRQAVSDAWLTQQLADTDVRPVGAGDGVIDVTLAKNGRDVLVRGRLRVTIQVPCARTLDPAVYQLSPEVFLLLGPKTGAGGDGPGHRGGRPHDGARTQARAEGRGQTARAQPAREARNGGKNAGGWEDDGLLDETDAARDTYSGDQVVLDDFLREFILLEIPMVPLREDLRKAPFEATPSPPGSLSAGESSQTVLSEANRPEADRPETDRSEQMDPRLSPLIALKARLEQKE